MSKEVKTVADSYKTAICTNIFELLQTNAPNETILMGYAYVLRHFFGQNDVEKVPQLLQYLARFVDFALENSLGFTTGSYLLLFVTILQNKSKIPEFDDVLVTKFWDACKENLTDDGRFEEYTQLVMLVIGHVSNENFHDVLGDLLNISVSFLHKNVQRNAEMCFRKKLL